MAVLRQAAWGALGRLSNALHWPGAPAQRLSVLIYHSVSQTREPLGHADVDAAAFAMHLQVLASAFNVLTLGEAARRLRDGTLPPRAACITFDDGYADNATLALPLLERHGLRATFFVATGYLDGGRMFNDVVIEAVRRCAEPLLDLDALGLGRHPIASTAERRGAIEAILRDVKHLPPAARDRAAAGVATAAGVEPDCRLMMTRRQVRELADAGMEIGGHTHTHPMLSRVPPATAREEIERCKTELEAITTRPVTVFAYPNGKPGRDYGPEHVAMVRAAGYDAAVSTASGVAHAGSDLFELPRFTPWDPTPERFLVRLIANRMRTRFEVAA